MQVQTPAEHSGGTGSGHEGGDGSPRAGQAGTEGPDTQLQGVWL